MSKRQRFPLAFGWQACLLVLLIALLTGAAAAGVLFLVTMSPQPAIANAAEPIRQWTAHDVLQAFHAAGLPYEIPSLPKDERDAFSSWMQVETKPFQIPNQGADANGMVLCFKNSRDLRRMQDYYTALGNALPQYRSWVFVQDNVLLQINRSVPEAVAARYAASLEGLNAW